MQFRAENSAQSLLRKPNIHFTALTTTCNRSSDKGAAVHQNLQGKGHKQTYFRQNRHTEQGVKEAFFYVK